MAQINYLLGSWSGHRIHMPNPGDYLRRHIDKLNSVPHNLAQISIGCPENPNMEASYRDYLKSLTTLDNGTPIVVYHMPNQGLSYGQYSYMFGKCRNQFSHFIFMEDDYLPAADHFDDILADWFDELYASENCGYLCSLMLEPNNPHDLPCRYIHAGVSNGISSNEVLNVIWDKFGCLPNKKAGKKPEQIVFSQGFTDCGYKICDILETYRCVYFQSTRKSLWLFGDKENDLILPVQYFDEEKPKFSKQKIDPKSKRPKARPQTPPLPTKGRRAGIGRRSGRGA